MLRYFFEKRDEDLSHLFEGLEVWSRGETYRRHFQRYPVVYLTFKDLKPTDLEEWRGGLRNLLKKLFMAHRGLLQAESDALLETTGLTEWRVVIDRWYNGCLFGEQVIYNPCSVLSFLEDSRHIPIAHWINTSANDLVRYSLERHANAVRDDVSAKGVRMS